MMYTTNTTFLLRSKEQRKIWNTCGSLNHGVNAPRNVLLVILLRGFTIKAGCMYNTDGVRLSPFIWLIF